jgi:ADP-ribose pyrophosphatase
MSTTDQELPRVLNSRKVFDGNVFDVTVDTIQEGELIYQRDVVRHPGSAVIVPVFADGTVALVKQYRHPTVRDLLEIPAGTLDEGEKPEVGAARELEEELGVVAGKMEKLSEFFVSPGFCEEKMWVYLATELTEGKQLLDDDEILEIVRLPIASALELITSGEIQDAKTIIGLMLAAPRVGAPMLDIDYRPCDVEVDHHIATPLNSSGCTPKNLRNQSRHFPRSKMIQGNRVFRSSNYHRAHNR